MNLKKIINPFGGLTYYKESTTSTMGEARNILTERDVHGSIFVTDFQTQGVGRIPGRIWHTKAKDNLTFTLVLEKDRLGKGYVTIPLKTGLAVSKALKSIADVDAKVKWPNDVIADNKKICGVLCQSDRKHILVGVGININQLEFDDEIKNKAISLSLLTNKGYSLEMVLSAFLEKLFDILNSETWLEELNEALYRKGEDVEFAIGDPKKMDIVNGELVGLDKNGKVLIKNSDNTVNSYISGEFL